LQELSHPPLVGMAVSVFNTENQEKKMLNWALGFLMVAIIAAIFGFTGIAASAVEIAKLIFIVFLVLFLIAAIMGVIRGRAPPL
jgi:uncharacterized membrane protein YtjA (UPF0391 family)